MGVKRLKAVLLLCVVWLTVPQGVFTQDPTPPVYRLPSTITPQLYQLRLDPDLDTRTINGTVRIQIKTTSDQSATLDSITLHLGSNVTVNETSGIIIDTDGSIQTIGAFDYDDANTLLTLRLPEDQKLLNSHIYIISLQFQSYLNTEPKGLFTGYFDSTRKYVASNFRPTHARDVFPCFDEPHYKVPVALQVLRPSSYYVISTAPLSYSSAVTADSNVLDTFSNTESISIHSLGLFIGQQPPVPSMGVNVIVPSAVPTTVPFLDTLISGILTQYGPFPHSPLNLIVLPDIVHTSFSSYGFVFTSPEVYLGKVGSALQWTTLQLQLTEEFLRQYLEYSKTPQWWSDLWLSESIGAYLSLPFQQDEPWLKDWLNIVVRSEALGGYTSPSGPVITDPDLSKWDIENIISNQTIKFKGLSTLLMWTLTMPDGLVAKTISDFLKLSQSVVNTTDLVQLMVSNINANTTYDVTPAIPLLPYWLTQPGSPLVWFSFTSSSTFTLDQAIPCPAGSPDPALRSISVALAEGSTADWNDIRQGRWLLNVSNEYPLNTNASEAVIINIETAPYRVNYEDSQWDTLTQAVSSGWAPAAVASALQDDAIALSLSGCLDFSTALSLLKNTQHSTMDWYPVVKATDAIISEIGSDWYGFTAFGSYFSNLFSAELIDKLDVRNSTSYPELSVPRELVTPWLCRFNIGKCREAVVELGGPLWQGNASEIAGSDLENVACYGARYTPGALEPLLGAYQSAENAWLRRYFTIALSCLTDQSSVNELLDIILNSTTTSTQARLRDMDAQIILNQNDARQILIRLASSVENSEAVVNAILYQAEDIQTRFGVSTLSSIIKNLAKNRADLSQLSSLKDGSVDLDPYVVQSVDEAVATSNLSQTWWSSYSSKLYQALPQLPTTTNPSTTGKATTTSTTTTQKPTSAPTPAPTHAPTPAPTPIPTTSKPAPSGVSALSDYQAFTFILAALLITVDMAVR